MAPTVEKKTPAGAAGKGKATPAGTIKVKGIRKKVHSKNYKLGSGIMRYSKSQMFHKKATYKFLKSKTPKTVKPKKPTSIVKDIGGEKNGKTRVVLLKKRKASYPTADKMPKTHYKKYFSRHVRNIRKNLEPGRVLILLAGRHKGKRVILVKILPSGLLLVSGPLKSNGCPLRRISQRYVIGTALKLDISSVKVPEHLDDKYFKKNKKSTKRAAKRKEGEDIFATKKERYVASDQRKADQKTVDDGILAILKKHPERKQLRRYLAATFGLRSSQYPHRMKF